MINMFKLESEEDNRAQTPMDLRYMKLLRFTLSLIFSWPHHVFGKEYKAPFYRNSVTIFCEGAFVCVGGTIYSKINFNKISFLESGKTYLTIILSVVSGHRVTIAWFQNYHKLMKQFLLELHLFHHRHKSEYYEHMYQKVHKICHIFATFIFVQLFLGIFMFNATPVFNNYMNGLYKQDRNRDLRFEHSIDYILPKVDQHRDLPAYIVVAIVNIPFSYDCGLNFCGFDIVLAVIVFHIWGHLKILEHNLRTIPTPIQLRQNQPTGNDDEMLYTEEENTEIAKILKDIINHHRMIVSVMKSTSEAFGLMLCLYYIFHQLSCIILLLECSTLDAKSLMRYGPLTITIFQYLIQISVIVELLGSQSAKLKDAAYSAPWEYMNTSNRKVILFLYCNMEEPIRLKPMGLVTVGVQTMASILKTTFSYYMLLSTFT